MFSMCKPIPKAVATINRMLRDNRFEIDILTVATAKTAYSEKLEWISRHFGEELRERTIGLASHAHKARISSAYDVLVEDNPLTLQKAAGNGCSRILFVQPHNHEAEYPRDFDYLVENWDELYDKLEYLWERI